MFLACVTKLLTEMIDEVYFSSWFQRVQPVKFKLKEAETQKQPHPLQWEQDGTHGKKQVGTKGRCNFEMATPNDWFLPTRSHLLKIPPTSKWPIKVGLSIQTSWGIFHCNTVPLPPLPRRLIVIKMYLIQLHKSQCLYRNTVQKSKVSGSAGKGACIQADPRTYMVEGESRLPQVILCLQHALHGTCMCPST